MTSIHKLYNIDEIQRVACPEAIRFLVIDLFCGAGGTSTGIKQAKDKQGNPIAIVMACVNHDPDAIDSHWANYPEVAHYEEDIRTLPLSPLIGLIAKYRKAYPWAKVVLWASLECTNFSRAKGGQSRDADSRTLAESLFRYIWAINPDYIKIENVVEFSEWGPLDDEGQPIKERKGEDFQKWCKHIHKIGYRSEWTMIDSADLGAVTSRNRLFGTFSKPDLPICWPVRTHAKNGKGGLKPWNAVKPYLWLDQRGESIFTRKKALVDNTLRRLISGIKKYHNDPNCFVNDGYGFLAKYYGTGANVSSLGNPAGALTTKDRFSLCWLDKQYSGPQNHSSLGSPSGTIMVSDKHQLASATIYNPSHGGHFMHISQPCPTIIARQDKAPLYLVFNEYAGDPTLRWIKPGDSEVMIELKLLMVKLNIFNVKLRMLFSEELKVIQGFPKYYKLVNGTTAAKKGIGNSVVPLVCKKMFEAYLYYYEQKSRSC